MTDKWAAMVPDCTSTMWHWIRFRVVSRRELGRSRMVGTVLEGPGKECASDMVLYAGPTCTAEVNAKMPHDRAKWA